MKKQSGFSLLELIIVIVVISLIAVIALPKYLNIVEEAKKSSVEGVAAGYAAAVLSARSQWEVNRRPKKQSGRSNYNYVELDGSPLWLTDNEASGLSGYLNGYPMSVREGNSEYTTTITNEGCVLLMEYLLQNPPLTQSVDVAQQDKSENVRYLAKAQSNTCIYFQQEGAKHSFTYEMKTGRVTVNLQP
ncbi:prepilin-type N-terminal cleavage/methylation domain-containing protein [Vibrio algivorus]|uniref:Prepilin-type N-terminal cleavage/methylation domain-containing protein n=1 Tax=Vibrio algivorus TaxID=1667024 RepID=A0A557PDB7_9VIBR|nr:prepilin-type N-terminal cleavage/methylation domain-containing protein [Vibrio algivorus]TVO38624.1 prepilin-type N-terminal cleavage/methylation domain-containing protein [Vibrio algivorus]